MKKNWQKDLSELAAVLRKQQKHRKSVKSKFDLDENFRGRKGFSDSGVALTEKTIKAQRKNKANYSRQNYAFSRLRFINDARAEAARQKRLQRPEYEKKINSVLDQVDKEASAAAKQQELQLKWNEYKSRPSHQQSFNVFKGCGYSDPPASEADNAPAPVDFILPYEKKEPEYKPKVSMDRDGNMKFKNKIDESIWNLKNNK